MPISIDYIKLQLLRNLYLYLSNFKKHLGGYIARFPKTVEVLGRLYVNDLSCSTESYESAMEIARTSKTILAEGAFNLQKFNSNSPELRKQLIVQLESEGNSKCETEHNNEVIQEKPHWQEGDPSCEHAMVDILTHHNTNKILF